MIFYYPIKKKPTLRVCLLNVLQLKRFKSLKLFRYKLKVQKISRKYDYTYV